MKKLLNKKMNDKGFTLAELLVVVAIIAILVAVSIPIFTAKLADARQSTDLANMRAAKAAAVNAYIAAEQTAGDEYFYDADNGKVMDAKANIAGYNAGDTKACAGDKDTQIVKVTIAANGDTVKATWEAVAD